ncbi:MAG: type II toxin-antitoxin system VapC family toxin [Solirubrobacteraceae bacterium]
MNALFVDTAGWMACADAADPAHARSCAARDAAIEAGRIFVTTDFVVDETLTLIRFRVGLAAAGAWWHQIDGSPRLRWERIDGDRFEKARDLFFQYKDKDFSFTDCTSFIVMHDLRLRQALTTDRHFRQMGFRLLPAARVSPPRRPRASVTNRPRRSR